MTTTTKVAAVIRAEEGVTVSEIARVIGARKQTVRWCLATLARYGWAYAEVRPIARRRSGPFVAPHWFPSVKLRTQPYRGVAYLDTSQRVLDAIGDDFRTVADLAQALNRPTGTVQNAVRRLVHTGQLDCAKRGRTLVVARPLVDECRPTAPWRHPYAGGAT